MIDFKELHEKIKEERKPILLERIQDGAKIAIVSSNKAADYWGKRGFITFTLDKLKGVLEKVETKKEKQEILKVMVDTALLFRGNVINEPRDKNE